MRTVLLLVLLLGGAGAAWWFLVRETPVEVAPEDSDAVAREGSSTPGTTLREADRPNVPNPWPPPPPARPDLEATWREVELTLPAGDGPITGREIIQAVEKAGLVRLRPREAADREALETARIEDVPRGVPMQHEHLLPLLMRAGLEVEPRYPDLWYRRRPEPTPVPPAADPPR